MDHEPKEAIDEGGSRARNSPRLVGGFIVRSIGSILFLLAVPAAALGGPREFVVEMPGVGGTAEQAAPYLDTFLRFTETALGWPPNSASGQFFPTPEEALTYIAEKRPGFGMIEPALFLELHRKESLTPIASVRGKGIDIGHYSVVVKDPALKTLADLKGKVLVSNHLQSPHFLSSVAFEGKIDVEKFFELKPTPSPLKGLKSVNRGEAAATLLDDEQLKNMKLLPFAASLRVLYTSAAIPPMPLVAFGKNAHPEDRAALAKLLVGMCSSAKGREVCKSLQIEKFTPPDQAAYEKAIHRFEK
jgi:ABC-type phosphate/phosphonate transport system substrate-binding protein